MSRFVMAALFCVVLNATLVAIGTVSYRPYPISWDIIGTVNASSSGFDPNKYGGLGAFFVFGDFVTAVMNFITLMFRSLYVAPYLMSILGVPYELAQIVQVGMWFVYGCALIEIIGGRKV